MTLQLSLLDPSEHDLDHRAPDILDQIARATSRRVLARVADRAEKAGARRVAEAADERRREIPRRARG